MTCNATPTMRQASSQVFRPKIDRWLVGVLAGTYLILGWAMWGLYRADGWESALAIGLMTLFSLGLVALFLPVRYTLEPDVLVVRSGVIRLRIKLDRLQRAAVHHGVRDLRRSLTALSLGLSLNGVLLEYGHARRPQRLFIAPSNRRAFFEALAARDEALQDTPEGVERISG